MDRSRCREILLSLFETGRPAYCCGMCRFYQIKDGNVCPLKMAEQILEAASKKGGK